MGVARFWRGVGWRRGGVRLGCRSGGELVGGKAREGQLGGRCRGRGWRDTARANVGRRGG